MPRPGDADFLGAGYPPQGPDDGPLQAETLSMAGNRVEDLADPLKWIGIALLGTYLVTVVAAALPVKLLDPAWINRICGSLRGGVSFPLEAMAAYMIGAYLQRGGKEPHYLSDLRWCSRLAALGFVLLIPLQSWAGLQLIATTVGAQQARLAPGEDALKAIYAATDADQLLAAIRRIPGAPPNIGGRLEEPVAKVRQRLISEIEPQVRQQKEQLKEVIGTIRRDSLIALVKDGVVALLSALAFAAIGRARPYRPTLLQKLVGAPSPSSSASDEFAKLAEEYQRGDEQA
jgi:hypothetical protein